MLVSLFSLVWDLEDGDVPILRLLVSTVVQRSKHDY